MRVPRRQSLISLTAQVLREGFSEGRWDGFLPGELELCRQLGISRVTLRGGLEILEDEGRVSSGQGKRRRIVGGGSSERLLVKAAKWVVLLSPVPLGSLTMTKLLWMDELREQVKVRALGFEFISSAAAAGARPARVLGDLTRRHPDALWVLLRATAAMEKWFGEARLPVVVAGSHYPGIDLPCVDIDYHATCRHAAGQLSARGCERLGLVTPQAVLAGDRDSEEGFREGAGARPVRAIRHDGSVDGLCRALDQALMEKEPPHGLLVFHSPHAVTTLTHLMRKGCAVPERLRIISRDDDPFLARVSPSLARYALKPDVYARQIARILFRQLDGSNSPAAPTLLLPDFVEGETARG